MGIDTQQTLAARGPSRGAAKKQSSPRATGSAPTDYGSTSLVRVDTSGSSSSSSSLRLQRAAGESLETRGSTSSRAKLSPHGSRRHLSDSPEQTQQWWENVLPPGQLAERLRRAQNSASSSSSRRPTPATSSKPSPHSTPATPSNEHSDEAVRRSTRNARTLPTRSPNQSDAAKRSPKMRSMTTLSSTATLTEPSKSLRSEGSRTISQPMSARSSFSHSDRASAASSGTEESPPTVRSPSLLSEGWASKYFSGLTQSHSTGGISSLASSSSTSGIKSPPNGYVTRSRSSRRSRVLSDSGHGLGLSVSRDDHSYDGGALQEHLAEYHFYRSAGSVPMTQSSSSQSSHNNDSLRGFPRSSSAYTFSNAFEDTPEASSEEDHTRDVKTPQPNDSSRQSSRRGSTDMLSSVPTRRSSLRGAKPERPSAQPEPSQRSRHVSFFPSVELVEGNNDVHRTSIGRDSGAPLSTSAHFAEISRRAKTQLSESANDKRSQSVLQFPGSNDDLDGQLNAHAEARGQRLPSYSAPTSPEHAFRTFPRVRRAGSRAAHPFPRTAEASSTQHIAQRTGRANDGELKSSAAEMALLSSLGAAQAQFASARNLASALTRQLSAPLRPMLHVTLFLSISSMAFFALMGFLVAGYLATAWDDINSHGKALQKNVSNASEGVKLRVRWTRQLLGMAPDVATTGASNAKATSSQRENEKHRLESETTNGTMPAFWRFTVALPSAVAHAVTPSVVMDALVGSNVEASASRQRKKSRTSRATPSDEGSSRSRTNAEYNAMPARPPLSSLLPSIAFTIVLALGAGLASFFASRATTTTPAAAGASGSGPASPSPRANPIPHEALSGSHDSGHLGAHPFARASSLHGRGKGDSIHGDVNTRSIRGGARRAYSTFGPSSSSSMQASARHYGASVDDGYTINHRAQYPQRHSPLLSGQRSPLSQL